MQLSLPVASILSYSRFDIMARQRWYKQGVYSKVTHPGSGEQAQSLMSIILKMQYFLLLPTSVILTTTTVLLFSGFCLGQPRWAGTIRNIHPLTTSVVINHSLSDCSIYYSPCSIYVPDSLLPQSLSKFSLVYLLAWHPPLHTPYISSPNDWLLFAAHAHTTTTRFAVVPRLCHLILVSLSTL